MTARDILAQQARALIEQLTEPGEQRLRQQLAAAVGNQRRWVLEIRPPVPMRTTNSARRMHWGKTSAERREWRYVAIAAARAAHLPTDLRRVRIDIEVRFTDRLRRDAANLHDQVCKPIVDALGGPRVVKDNKQPTGFRMEPGYRLVPDDTPEHVDGPHVTIGEPVDRRRFPYGLAVVTITDQEGRPVAADRPIDPKEINHGQHR